ncbi:MAG: hypothetical protein AAF657_14715 [Acidobacteriota bacterium]
MDLQEFKASQVEAGLAKSVDELDWITDSIAIEATQPISADASEPVELAQARTVYGVKLVRFDGLLYYRTSDWKGVGERGNLQENYSFRILDANPIVEEIEKGQFKISNVRSFEQVGVYRILEGRIYRFWNWGFGSRARTHGGWLTYTDDWIMAKPGGTGTKTHHCTVRGSSAGKLKLRLRSHPERYWDCVWAVTDFVLTGQASKGNDFEFKRAETTDTMFPSWHIDTIENGRLRQSDNFKPWGTITRWKKHDQRVERFAVKDLGPDAD